MLTVIVGLDVGQRNICISECSKDSAMKKAGIVADSISPNEKSLKRKIKLARWNTCIVEPVRRAGLLNPLECTHTKISDEYGKLVCEDCGLLIGQGLHY